jgi:DnaK suppressor protein
MTTIDLEQARRALSEERKRLCHQLSELGGTDAGELRSDVEYGDGFADAAAATAERTERLGLIDRLHRSLEQVDRALAKIDEGTYGRCEQCGEAIGAARMEARPTSTLCVDCKSNT